MFQYLKREICDDVLSQKGLYIPKTFVKEYSWTFEIREYKKASVSEAYVGPCQLSVMDLFAKIVKDFSPFTISAKIFPSHRMFDRVLNKPLYTLSNSFILENCFILSFSIICPFHMRTIYLQTAHTYTPPVAERYQLTTNDTRSLIINAIISYSLVPN